MPYTQVVQERDDDTGHYFYGKILELDGCQSSGETLDELYANLQEAMEGYIELKLERNLPIPDDFMVRIKERSIFNGKTRSFSEKGGAYAFNNQKNRM